MCCIGQRCIVLLAGYISSRAAGVAYDSNYEHGISYAIWREYRIFFMHFSLYRDVVESILPVFCVKDTADMGCAL